MKTNVSTIPEGVTLYPSEEEFANFRNFINTLESRPELQNQGIVKVKIKRLFHPPVLGSKAEMLRKRFKNLRLFAHWSRKSMEIKVKMTRCI
jgi:hypothetical protein